MSGVLVRVPGGRSTRKGSSLRRRSTAVLVGSLIALTAAAGCSSSKAGGSGTGSAGAAVGDTLTFGAAATPPTLNPATATRPTGCLQWAYDPLVVMKPDGTFAAGLATKWGYVGAGNKIYE